MSQTLDGKVAVIGIDIGKNSFHIDALSSASRPMQQRPDLLDRGAVLRAVKAWPGNTGASRNVIATASLAPCARRARAPAGRDMA